MMQDMALNDSSNTEGVISSISLKYKMIPSDIEKLSRKDVLRMYSFMQYENKNKEQ
jgi:hypothetical protein